MAACGPRSLIMRPLFWTPEFVHLGADVMVWRDARIEGITRHGDQQFSPQLLIADRAALQQGVHVTFAGRMEIGARTAVMARTVITDIDHDYRDPAAAIADQKLIVSPTRLGQDCFIGAGACIQAGTQIGDHCIVGANSVVRGQFPSHCVIAGAPARIIRRFDFDRGEWVRVSSTES